MATFSSPSWLALLLLVPCFYGFYFYVLRRRATISEKYAQKKTAYSLFKEPRTPQRDLFLHFLIIGFVCLVISTAGPFRTVHVPQSRTTVILAIDTSNSMKATDVLPNRITLAEKIATRIINNLQPDTNIGIVTFDSSPIVRSKPTTAKNVLTRNIRGLETGPGTATGAAINLSLKLIDDFQHTINGPENNVHNSIVLISDGKQTSPSTNPNFFGGAYTAAHSAQAHGTRIQTISVGTSHAAVTVDGKNYSVPVDTRQLRQIAAYTQGHYFSAENAQELPELSRNIVSATGFTTERRPNGLWWTLGSFVFSSLGFVLIYRQKAAGEKRQQDKTYVSLKNQH